VVVRPATELVSRESSKRDDLYQGT
jgi:hypothetical protein